MDRYEVVVVRYSQPCQLNTWRDVPARYVEAATPMRDLALPLAATWVRAFNQAELAKPYGVWAMLRQQGDADGSPIMPSIGGAESGGEGDAD